MRQFNKEELEVYRNARKAFEAQDHEMVGPATGELLDKIGELHGIDCATVLVFLRSLRKAKIVAYKTGEDAKEKRINGDAFLLSLKDMRSWDGVEAPDGLLNDLGVYLLAEFQYSTKIWVKRQVEAAEKVQGEVRDLISDPTKLDDLLKRSIDQLTMAEKVVEKMDGVLGIVEKINQVEQRLVGMFDKFKKLGL